MSYVFFARASFFKINCILRRFPKINKKLIAITYISVQMHCIHSFKRLYFRVLNVVGMSELHMDILTN